MACRLILYTRATVLMRKYDGFDILAYDIEHRNHVCVEDWVFA